MKRKYLLGFLLILSMIFFIIPTKAYEDTEYLIFGSEYYGFADYGVEMNEGDNLTWSFETRLEEFEVLVKIDNEDISEGLEFDSGVWIAPRTDTFWIIFINYDILLQRDGYIDIYFEVNVEPEPEPEPEPEDDDIIGIDLIPLITIISLATVIPLIIITRRRKK